MWVVVQIYATITGGGGLHTKNSKFDQQPTPTPTPPQK